MMELLFAAVWVLCGGVTAPYLIMVCANRNYVQLGDVPTWTVLTILGPITAIIAALTFTYESVDAFLPIGSSERRRKILPW